MLCATQHSCSSWDCLLHVNWQLKLLHLLHEYPCVPALFAGQLRMNVSARFKELYAMFSEEQGAAAAGAIADNKVWNDMKAATHLV